jgi:hypothetical protein
LSSLFDGRAFQFWEYHVSHGRLLIRSPGVKGAEKNVDVIFHGVEFVSLCRFLHDLRICEANPVQRRQIEKLLGKDIALPNRTGMLEHSSGKAVVVACRMDITENREEYMKSTFWE